MSNLTNYELNLQLAKAIGWSSIELYKSKGSLYVSMGVQLKKFDYMDWAVIGPIATKYNCFSKNQSEQWQVDFITKVTDKVGFVRFQECSFGETPQEAIAKAVLRITRYPDC